MERLEPSDIPEQLISEIQHRVTDFTVGLVQLGDGDAYLRGSGTLIELGSSRAILTAHHVLDVLPTTGRVGMILSPDISAFTVETAGLHYLGIARGNEHELGPDLGAIILPPDAPSSLVAKKSFVNLAKHRERMLQAPPETDDGLWCVSGYQDELTDDIEPSRGFKRVKRFRGFMPIGCVKEAPVSNAFDYFTFPVPHRAGLPMPDRIGGTSGAGLWQITLARDSDGHLKVKDCLLSGVAFYQGPVQKGSSLVRCHGRSSVYKSVYCALQGRAGVLK